jgi:hypothetical protein
MKNPKQKLKNILLLLTVFFAISCSKDVYEEEFNEEKIIKKRITFEEFSSNKKAIKEFTVAKNELQSKSFESKSFERAAYNQDLNIVIDTDNIQLIEIDDYKSYTIPFIAEGRENKVDNIVIVEKGNYIDVKFISYNLTKQQLSLMNFGTIENTILLRNKNAIETECNSIVDTAEIYINPATGQISGYVVTYANPCQGTAGNSYIIQYIDSEGSTGGDGSSSGDFSGGNNSGILNFWSNLFGNNYSNGGFGTGEIYTLGGGGLGGSNTSNLGGSIDDNWDSTDVVTNPVISEINSQNAALMLEVSAYLNHLKNQNTVINQFLTNNSNVYQFIINYVLQNGGLTQELKNTINFTLNNIGSVYTTLEQNSNNLTTDEVEVLKNKAFQFLILHGAWLAGQSATTQQSILQNLTSLEKIDNIDKLTDVAIATGTTFTIDPTVNATNGQVFNNANDLEDYLNAGNSSNSTTQVNNINGERISTAVFDLDILINLEIDIKQSTNPFSVSDVTSDLTGFTFTRSWHQTSYYKNQMLNNPSSYQVGVKGRLESSIFFNGIGTIYVKNKHFEVLFDKINGHIWGTIQH